MNVKARSKVCRSGWHSDYFRCTCSNPQTTRAPTSLSPASSPAAAWASSTRPCQSSSPSSHRRPAGACTSACSFRRSTLAPISFIGPIMLFPRTLGAMLGASRSFCNASSSFRCFSSSLYYQKVRAGLRPIIDLRDRNPFFGA